MAACLPRRNEQECRKRWQSKLAVQTKTGAWSTEEDESLRQAVAKHGLSWVLVASKVGNRSGDQCFKRWNDAVNPELDHSPWLPVDVSCRTLLSTIPGLPPLRMYFRVLTFA